MSQTEEDIKVKLILPFLKSLGFSEDELGFEKSFFIRLPKDLHEIDTQAQIKTARPRLDILVTRDGKNLFVIEVKTDSKKLTDDDKEQAVCYARLVHPIAPVSIVTNGKSTKMYKTIDKVEVQWDKEKILGYECGEDLEQIYEEALEYFIGYSSDNIREFCNQQIQEGMNTLLGSKSQPHKKFIPELYIASQKLRENFDNFLKSEKSVFSLVGDSGSSKTCSMCGLARDLNRRSPVFFYRAPELTKSIAASIADDFNWAFSPQYSEIPLLKKVCKIFKEHQFLVFIDGVDEWSNQEKVEILGEFVKHIKGKNIKLIISCKAGQWDLFLNKNGIPTYLSDHVYSVKNQFSGFPVEPFEESEFLKLIDLYRSFYDFHGLFEDEVLGECRQSPFLLRIFFEVARNAKCEHLTFSIREFYDEYYKCVLLRIHKADRGAAERILNIIANLQFAENEDPILEEIIRKKLGLAVHESLLPTLFEANILERSRVGHEYRISFYFKKLRDYVIAFHAEKWDIQSIEEFRKSWNQSIWLNVKLDAVVLFYQLANLDKKWVLDRPSREKADLYLSYYTELTSKQFRNFRHQFLPWTFGDIGFLGILDIQNQEIKAYGFRKIKEGDDPIKFVPDLVWNREKYSNNLAYILGLEVLKHPFPGAEVNNIRAKVLENEIRPQLTEIVRYGLLNEENCFYLSLEKALGLIVRLQRTQHGIEDIGKLTTYLPIDINKVEYELRKAKALHAPGYKENNRTRVCGRPNNAR